MAFFLGALALAAALGAGAVKARAKDRDDGEDVVRKLALWGVSVVCFHDDFCAMLLEKPLEQIVCKAVQAVSVGNAHDSYTSRKRELQKRLEAFPPEVDAAADICEDLMVRVLGL